MSKTGRFYLALQEEREQEDQLREELHLLLGALSLKDPKTADQMRTDIAEIEARVLRIYATVWHRVETSLSVESSEILSDLAGYVAFLLMRDCEKWVMGKPASASQVAPERSNE